MNTLYLLGGPPRVGKSIIMAGLIEQHPMPLVASDAVQEGVRHLFVEDPFQILQEVRYEGWARYKKRGTGDQIQDGFENQADERELARRAIIGMLDHYARNKSDVAIEGIHVTPGWVQTLNLADFTIRAAFVGYTDPSYVDAILKYASNNEHDWINEWLEHHDGDDSKLRSSIANQAERNKQIADEARDHGYPYFDAGEKPFDEYVNDVRAFFLAK